MNSAAVGVLAVMFAGPVSAESAAVQPPVVAKVTVDRAELLEGQTIKVCLTLTNSGDRDAVFEMAHWFEPKVVDAAGADVLQQPGRAWLRCGGIITGEPYKITVPARGSEVFVVQVLTDPLGSMQYRALAPGTYTVSLPLSLKGVPAPSSVPVTIKPLTEYQLGRRIRFAGIAHDRVTVLREDGQAQSFSLKDGRELARVEIGNITATMPALDWAEFSPDATSLVRVVDVGTGFAVHVCDVATGSVPRLFHVPAGNVGSQAPHLRGFDRVTGALRLSLAGGMYDMNTSDGTFHLVPGWFADSEVSPDGAFAIAPPSNLRRRGGSEIVAEWPGGYSNRLMGAEGLYGTTFDGQCAWRSYDGKSTRRFEGYGDLPFVESADGKLVAWGRGSRFRSSLGDDGGEIRIFSTSDQRLVWTLRDRKPRFFSIVSEPPRLVSLPFAANDSSESWLIDRVDVYDLTPVCDESSRLIKSFDVKPAKP